MTLTIAFQMEPLAECNMAKNNSLSLMQEATRRGYRVMHFQPHELSLEHGTPIARMREAMVDMHATPYFTYGKDEILPLSKINAVLVRQNPPFDMNYITNTYILQQCAPTTHVFNPPQVLRDWPEKIIPLLFPQLTIPTLITADTAAIAQFHADHHTVIVKPLYMFGGADVFRFEAHELEMLQQTAQDICTRSGAPVVLQRFIPQVVEGDKRMVFVNGEYKGAFIRVPEDGSYYANTDRGGSINPYPTLTARDKEICDGIVPFLKKHQVLLCGIDVIGDYLTEVNITSPAGFRQVDGLYGTNVVGQIIDSIEQQCR